MGEQPGLSIRRNRRHELLLPGEVVVDEVHRSQVRLAGARAGEVEAVSVDIVDFSSGGLGVVSETFFPKKCRLIVRVFPLGQPEAEPILEAPVRVQRIVMTDRRPAYLIGTSFDGLSDEQRRGVEALIDRIEGIVGVRPAGTGGADA
ncbi:MAG: PilZ domain-containing protein [Phycisphaerales bacterium JB037]